jgi:hypothetical protein
MSGDGLDLWLEAAGFDELDELEVGAAVTVGDDRAPGDDPWADVGVAPDPLTADQRAFVEATSPGLGAALGAGSLVAGRPFDELDDAEIGRADADVIDFDDVEE